MILWVALASLFAVMLGYSRVPYAAAVDGAFLKYLPGYIQQKISLMCRCCIGRVCVVFSLLFKIKYVIDGILAMRIMVQFIGQAVGVTLLRKRNGTRELPYKMPLYPLPVILAIIMWLFVFYATGLTIIVSFFMVLGSGLIMYFIWQKCKANGHLKRTRIRVIGSRKVKMLKVES
jgi:amino acid transporter